MIIFQEDWGGYNLVAWKPSSGCQQALAGDRGFKRFICPVVAFTVFALSVHFLLTYLATGMMAGDVYRENSVVCTACPRTGQSHTWGDDAPVDRQVGKAL